ncbi:MAG TPA: FtsX-like permease family protein [Bdellovibrionota bacterium]|nr:FtsX-like permease family protein [Bdellovibrionota bacterium]
MKNSTPTETPKRDVGAVRHLWASPWTGWVGIRYLKSKKNSRFLSFITLLSIAGVALGVTAMIVVLSVMDGFEFELKKRLTASDLHILVTPTRDAPGFVGGFVPKSSVNPTELVSQMKTGGEILSFWPIVSTEAILRTGRKVTGIVLKGVTEQRMERLQAQIVETAEPQMLVQRDGPGMVRLPGIFVGQELGYEMGLIPGDQVSLISPTETEGPLQAVPRLKRYVIEGIYRSGLPEQELHTVFASDQAVRSFLRRADTLSQWEISVRNFDRAPAVASELSALLPQFKVQDWNQLNAHLFASLRLERVAMSVILAFIVVVASFNIVTTLTLMVLEKKREIAILKAMGARQGQVAAVFLAEGLLIGTLGIFTGAGLGFVLCSILRRYEFIRLPEVYYDRTLPVTFDYRYYLGVSICALLIVLAACLYPSRRAARLNPLDGIRFGA